MILTVTTCLYFCLSETSPILYESLNRCFQQGAIISGTHIGAFPRTRFPIAGSSYIVCKDSISGEEHTLLLDL